MGMPTQTIVQQVGERAGYCGSAVCITLSFLNEYAAAIGVSIALITYVTNLVFQIRKERRERNK